MENPTLTAIANYISRNSVFSLDDWEDNDFIMLSTRENGDIENETPGQFDIDKAKKLIDIILHDKEWASLVTAKMETVDEWVQITVTLIK